MKKKSRKKQSSLSPFVFFGVVLLVVLLGAGRLLMHVGPDVRMETDPEIRLRSLTEDYFAEKSVKVDHWWLERLPRPDEADKIHTIITNRLFLIHTILESYRSVSPLADDVHTHFSDFFVTLAIDSQRSASVMNNSEKRRIGTVPELSFVPRDRVPFVGTRYAIYWRSDWGMVMHAVDYPQAAFAGFLYHELGHGFLHPIGPYAPYNAHGSRDYALEECRMHELETLVDDRASKGAFKARIARILGRVSGRSSFKEAICAMTMDDLHEFDRMLGARDAGMETSELLIAEYCMAVGLEFIQDHRGGDEEKVSMFRWVESTLK